MVEGGANELPDFVVFQAVVKYCLFITTVPIISFFLVKNLLFDWLFNFEPITSNVYSAVVAVLVLHITLGLFIYRAYSEAEKPAKPITKVD